MIQKLLIEQSPPSITKEGKNKNLNEENKRLTNLLSKEKKAIKDKEKELKKVTEDFKSYKEKASKQGIAKIIKENEILTHQIKETTSLVRSQQEELSNSAKQIQLSQTSQVSSQEMEELKKERDLFKEGAKEMQTQITQLLIKNKEYEKKNEKLIEKLGELEYKLKDKKKRYEKQTQRLLERFEIESQHSEGSSTSPRKIADRVQDILNSPRKSTDLLSSPTTENILPADRTRSYTTDQSPPSFRPKDLYATENIRLSKELQEVKKKKEEEVGQLRATILQQVFILQMELERVRTTRSTEIIKLQHRINELESSPQVHKRASPMLTPRSILNREATSLLSHLEEGNFDGKSCLFFVSYLN